MTRPTATSSGDTAPLPAPTVGSLTELQAGGWLGRVRVQRGQRGSVAVVSGPRTGPADPDDVVAMVKTALPAARAGDLDVAVVSAPGRTARLVRAGRQRRWVAPLAGVGAAVVLPLLAVVVWYAYLLIVWITAHIGLVIGCVVVAMVAAGLLWPKTRKTVVVVHRR